MFSVTLPGNNKYHIYFSYQEIPTKKSKVVKKTLKVLTDDETIEERVFKIVEKVTQRECTAHLLIREKLKDATEIASATVKCSLQDNFEKNRGRKLALSKLLRENFGREFRGEFWAEYFSARGFKL